MSQFTAKIVSEKTDQEGVMIFKMESGETVCVTEYAVSFDGESGSSVDYYYSDDGGYGCKTPQDVAIAYTQAARGNYSRIH
jgi:hypothetical protein